MRRIPPLYGRFGANYEIKHWNFTAESLFAGKQSRLAQGDKDDNRIPFGGTPGWHALNLYAGYTADVFSIRTGLQNIFNEDYRTHGSGINGVGRSGWLSVQFNF
jgi:outer membrane receptor protein involved in Fe transport